MVPGTVRYGRYGTGTVPYIHKYLRDILVAMIFSVIDQGGLLEEGSFFLSQGIAQETETGIFCAIIAKLRKKSFFVTYRR